MWCTAEISSSTRASVISRSGTTCCSCRTSHVAVEAGIDPLEAARQTDLGAFADLLDAERIVGNLHRERWVTYEFIEPLWGEMLAEHPV
jgi:hypothetical protein